MNKYGKITLENPPLEAHECPCYKEDGRCNATDAFCCEIAPFQCPCVTPNDEIKQGAEIVRLKSPTGREYLISLNKVLCISFEDDKTIFDFGNDNVLCFDERVITKAEIQQAIQEAQNEKDED